MLTALSIGHRIVEVSARVLLVCVAGTLSSAQTANPANSPAIEREANVHGSPVSAGFQTQQAYLSSSEKNGSDHQSSGYISGTVLDQSGAVNAGAEVCLTDEGRASKQQVKSGSNGQFLFANVAPGSFRLTVVSAGFATREFSAALRPGETYLVPPIILVVATAVTEVHVKDSPLTPAQVADMQIKEQERQRVFGLFPNYYVSYSRDALPINTKQKFRLAWKTTTDPFTIVGVAALAGVEQATNTFEGYGQGAQGYFKRLGASYTDAVTATFVGSAVLPSLLKQDPRYFYKGTGSTRSRLLYALASPLICKGDNMRWQPNYSNVAGSFASAGISYLYYPRSDRNGAGLVVQNSLIRLGEIAFEGVLQEFVIRRLTPHLRNRASTAPQASEQGLATGTAD
ncbi:MAG TPA: carboxypeptidase-like regulatory domain-containing protein [Terriglobales bacterium]|nr:carboxypeptidase-like regulatory domain-containing protein [Terriglobales bacterium]